MSVKKYWVSVLLGVFLLSSISPQSIFALPKDSSGVIDQSGMPNLSQEVQLKLLNQKKHLQYLGNPQEYSQVQIQWDRNRQKPSDIRKLRKRTSKDIVSDTKKVLTDFSSVYGINPSKPIDIRLKKDAVSKLTKERHSRMQQFYQNLEIVGGEIISHTDREGFLYQIDGSIDMPTISTKPSISSDDALAIGEREQGKKAHFRILKKPELVLYKFASAYVLVYRYTVGYDDPVAHKGQWIYYIDAHTGKKINAYNLINDALIPVALSGSLLNGEGGSTQTFTGTFDTINNEYVIYDNFSPYRSYFVFNASSNTGIYSDGFNYAMRNTSDWGVSDPTEISAGYNIAKTLEYYNTLGFGTQNIAFSSTGQTELPVFVHYGSGYDNAFWNPGVGLYMGDGDGVNLKPLATLDIMAHEFGHAWTENTSNLAYQDEQWALNESFSDISGVNVELSTQQNAGGMYPSTGSGQADWFIGEDTVMGVEALRDMRNPANTATVGTGNEQPTKYRGNHWYFGTHDNGWVHQNSSVQNFFYYLLTEGWSGNNEGILYSVDGIGIENARRIAFETNTNFVTSTTDYKGVRQAWIDAANSLHPTDPSFANSVKAAWDAVGVVADPIIPLATTDESFENGTSLPVGWDTSVSGSGAPWGVTTTTGALGNSSLISGVLANNSSGSVSWSWVTDAGYMTFYWRTSSEATYDTLDFYVDGVSKKSWSGINPWSFYSEAVTSGSHTFTWVYEKDISMSGWLDQAGIDAVHAVSMTGSLSYASDTGSGQYVSGAWFHGLFDAPTSYDYIVSRSDGQMSKGSASWVVSFPLSGMLEGSWSIDFQYRDPNGFLSQIFTQTFFLDSVAPSTPQILFPLNGGLYNTGNITLSWGSVTDSGAGLSATPFSYFISTNSGFTDIVASGSTGQNLQSLALADGTYFAKVQARDLAGNMSSSSITSFVIDSMAPSAPTNISMNHGTVIDAANQTNILVSGSGGVSESGSVVTCIISDTSGGVSGSGVVDAFGNFSLSGINVSTLEDGILTYTVSLTDGAGNVSPNATGTIGKSVIPADGALRFLSGSYTNASAIDLEISAAKPVSYVLSGSSLTEVLTGTIASSGSVIIPVTLSGADGNQTIQIVFTDNALVETTAFASIVLDRTLPTLSIQSHASGAQVIGAAALLTGSIFDVGGIASATLNSVPLVSLSNWSQNVNLVGGDNIFTLTVTDNAGNTVSLPVTIERLIAISHIVSTPVPRGAQLTFDTDLSSTGVVVYGTDSGALNLAQNTSSSDGLMHSATITGLPPDTLYYYQVHVNSGVLAGQDSSILWFRTPKVIDIAVPFDTISSTGSVVFSGTSATGSTVFSTTGLLSVQSESNSTDWISFSFRGLTITTSGTGTWDGIIEPPKVTTLTGVTLPESWYMLTGSVYKAGNESVPLGFSGQTATVQIFVGNGLNGKTLHVYRSDSGWAFALIDACTVSSGLCQFLTDHFSYFAFWDPNDSTPDAFSFAAKTGIGLATSTDSDPVVVAGINIPATISISGGYYSINNLAYTTATGTVSSGDSVKVRVLSSASNSSTTQTTLTIWGVSANFSVTTKAASVVSSGGGGGGSSLAMDDCPTGDTSGNYYDGKCTLTQLSSTGVVASSEKAPDKEMTGQGTTAVNTLGNSSLVIKNSKKNIFKAVIFQDIESSFAKSYIEKLVANRVVSGYADGKFHPENNITRAEFLKMVIKGLNIVTASNLTASPFSDVAESWQIPFVARAKELGIISWQEISGKLKFRPNDTVTRAEAMKILLLAAWYTSNVRRTDFTDITDSWQIPFVARAKELGIVSWQEINGKLKFRPNDTMTRAEVAKVIVKVMEMKK